MIDAPGPPVVVFKIGGSFLDWPPLPGRLAAYLASRLDIRPVLVVGGGRLADHLRDLDRIHGLGESRSHALALRLLDATAHILAALLPRSVVVDDLDALNPAWSAGLAPILAPRLLLDADDLRQPDDALPHDWSVTTDSIAARLAVLLSASELTVIKRSLPPHPLDPITATALGLTDPHFPTVAARLPLVRFDSLGPP